MKDYVDQSLHQPSTTRWSAKLKAVAPFKENIASIANCLEQCLTLKLSPKIKSELNGAIRYVKSFECILMACLWLKILRPIDVCNNIIQSATSTIDMEVDNLDQCLQNLTEIEDSWNEIVKEAKSLATSANVDPNLPSKRHNAHQTDDERLADFKTNVLITFHRQVKDPCPQLHELPDYIEINYLSI